MRDKFIKVFVYADSTNLFTEEDCNTDNLVTLEFPDAKQKIFIHNGIQKRKDI